MLLTLHNKVCRGHKMIISGNFYQNQTTTTTTEQNKSTESKQTDSLAALKTFFGDGSLDGGKVFDKVQISQQALSVLEDYVEANGTTSEDPLLDLIKQNAAEEYLSAGSSDEEAKSALDSLSEYLGAFNEKQMNEVYAKIKEANSQLSGDFISDAALYGVQSLL